MVDFKGPMMNINIDGNIDGFTLELRRRNGENVAIGTNFDMDQKLGKNDLIPKAVPITEVTCIGATLAVFLFEKLWRFRMANITTMYNGHLQQYHGSTEQNCFLIAQEFQAFINAY